ncbi:hypothetical protein B296_00006726 [Ensete ventricosum]|uniref:Uncharacterized protein n=1 Tax=Ensete ventricosum TaxID=4639 RepID=A0A426YUZ6_ENSVE|nr:hypothetical protein B296_00006726 [Ensete ventricosum]
MEVGYGREGRKVWMRLRLGRWWPKERAAVVAGEGYDCYCWSRGALGRENIAAEAAGGMASVPLLVGADATLVVHEEDDLMHKDALAKE